MNLVRVAAQFGISFSLTFQINRLFLRYLSIVHFRCRDSNCVSQLRYCVIGAYEKYCVYVKYKKNN